MRRFLINAVLFATIGTAADVDLYGPSDVARVSDELAQKTGGFASRDLKQYPNHHTMIAYRAATGSSEVHEHEADIFVVEAGEAQLLTGGKMVGGHAQKPGEIRGASIQGGEKRPLKTGDIVHIPAGVPHQLLVSPGKPITYFVVKVSGQ